MNLLTKSFMLLAASVMLIAGAYAPPQPPEGGTQVGYPDVASQSLDSEGNYVFSNNDGESLVEITRYGGINLTGNLTSTGNISFEGFFDQDKCGDSEAIKTIYPNGSYACNQLSTTTEAEGLSETLEANSTANQSIDFSGDIRLDSDPDAAVKIGSEGYTYNPSGVLIGQNVTTAANDYVSIGDKSEVSDAKGVAIGYNATADNYGGLVSVPSLTGALAVGADSFAEYSSTALGYNSEALSEGAVAIGQYAQAPNSYEATFGNLQGEELDVNVTGNATIHGSGGLSFEDGSAVISLGDNYKIYGDKFGGAGAITIGDSSTSSGGTGSLTIGKGASTSAGGVAVGNDADGGQAGAALGSTAKSGYFGAALGNGADASGTTGGIAIGGGANANADGAVAIGRKSKAPNKYETTLGALSGTDIAGNSVRMDLNVTGNATVHGSGGLNVTSGDVVGDDIVSRSGADLAEVYSAERDYEPGTVVSVSSGGEDVEKSSRFEDVAGVVSTDPGFTLNSGEEGVEVALEGRVPVKVAEPVEEGEDLAAGPKGKAVACETGQVEELSSDASKSKIVDAVNSLSSNQECLKASFGEALNSSQNGNVEVMLD